MIPGEVSAALRRARKEQAMSMERAAKIAQISTSLWTQVEGGAQYKGGERVPATTTADTLRAMALAVGLDPAPLLAEAGLESEEAGAPIGQVANPAAIVDLNGLSEQDLRTVAAYVAGLRAGRGI